MKAFEHHICDFNKYEIELSEFKNFLSRKTELFERKDILPFFRERRQLSSQIATTYPNIISPKKIAFEYDIFGDFSADLVVGDPNTNTYCFIEFEDATKKSLFATNGKKYKPDFSSRINHGYSQIIDWFYKLDGLQNSNAMEERFGSNRIEYEAIIIAGRNSFLNISQRSRLEWRSKRTVINSRHIHFFTLDDLYVTLNQRLGLLKQIVQ